MSVLPLNWPDKVDSPELLAWLQQFGLEKYIDSNQINSIRDAINELYLSSNPDRIISLGTETIVGNEYTYEGYTWQLGGVQINNIGNPSVIVIPSATTGFKRNDISVFKSDGTIERIAGIETDGETVTTPDIPEGTLYFKTYFINGSTVEAEPEPPAIDGSIYKKKIENTRWKSTQSGANVVIPFQAAGQSHYSVVHSGLISVAGFSTAALTTPMYEGQDVLFENQTGNPITLKDSFAGVNAPFDLGADLVVPNEGKIWFRSRNGLLELIMKSWSEISSDIIIAKGFPSNFVINATNQWYTLNHPFLTATWNTSVFYGSDALPTFAVEYKDRPALINSFGKPLKSIIWAIDYGDYYELDICIIKTDSYSYAQGNHRAVLMPYHIRVLTTTPSLNHPNTAPFSKYQIEIPVNDFMDTPSDALNSAYHLFIKGQANVGSNRGAIYFKF